MFQNLGYDRVPILRLSLKTKKYLMQDLMNTLIQKSKCTYENF